MNRIKLNESKRNIWKNGTYNSYSAEKRSYHAGYRDGITHAMEIIRIEFEKYNNIENLI